MSTRIGTLQPKARTGRGIWPVAVLALLVAATVAVILTSPEADRAPRTPAVTGTANNTPSELRGGILQSTVGNTAANTPTELSGGGVQFAAAQVSGSIVAARAKQLGVDAGFASEGPSANGPIAVRGDDCPICWKYR